MSYKNKTLDEAYESLEEAVADLVYFRRSLEAIQDAVEREFVRANERLEVAQEEWAQ